MSKRKTLFFLDGFPGSVRVPEGFFEGKPKVAKPQGCSPRGFGGEGLPEENPEGALTLPRSTV